jgi:hypothetical protein
MENRRHVFERADAITPGIAMLPRLVCMIVAVLGSGILVWPDGGHIPL